MRETTIALLAVGTFVAAGPGTTAVGAAPTEAPNHAGARDAGPTGVERPANASDALTAAGQAANASANVSVGAACADDAELPANASENASDARDSACEGATDHPRNASDARSDAGPPADAGPSGDAGPPADAGPDFDFLSF